MNSLKNYDELSLFSQGLIKGQLIMLETIKLQIGAKATHENMTLTFNKIEKQLTTGEL